MRRVGKNVFTEVYTPGCNPSFIETTDGVVMIDSPQQPIDAVRWRERMQQAGPIRYLINTEPHGDHTLGNRFFQGVPVVGHSSLAPVFEAYTLQMRDGLATRALTEDLDSVWLWDHPDYQAVNGPTVLFDDALTLNVGNHTFHCIHMGGHTGPQTTIHVPEEGVAFTGDNVFCRCKTWLQEADPWAWLDALKAIDQLDVETIVPGHGEPCTKAYLKDQGQIVENWMGMVGRLVDQGIGEDEAMRRGDQLAAELDPYPLGQRLEDFKERINGRNVRNLYRLIAAKRAGRAPPEDSDRTKPWT